MKSRSLDEDINKQEHDIKKHEQIQKNKIKV